MQPFHRYKAAILPYVLVITLVGGIIVSSIMLRFYLSLKESDVLVDQWMIEKDIQSALVYGMHQDVFEHTWEEVPFTGRFNSATRYMNDHWGIFGLTKAESKRENRSLYKAALWGRRNREMEYSLYLAELQQHFTVSGNTHIEGTCYIPEAGIRKGYIEGKNFTGTLPDPSGIKHAKRELPSIEENYWKSLCRRIWPTEVDLEETLITDLLPDTLTNSFFEPTVRIKSNRTLYLNQGLLEGNIIVESTTEIIVNRNMILKGILLIAPRIRIESDNGSYFQAFAREQIVLKEKSSLAYPSALCLIRDKNFKGNTHSDTKLLLNVEKECAVKGVLLAVSENYDPAHPILLRTGEESEIEGEVYSSGMAEIRGSILGSLTCEEFYLETTSSSYKNHLLDARISLVKRSPDYSGLPVKSKNYEPSVIQFLK